MSESNTSSLEAEELVMDHRAVACPPIEHACHAARNLRAKAGTTAYACAAANVASPISSDLSDRYPKNPALSPGFFVPVCRSRCAGGIFFWIRQIEWRNLNVPNRCRRRCANFQPPEPDGKTVKKDDFAGRYVLLWWYPKADTPG